MHLNHYENPYSRLARYELRMRQHGLTAQAMLMTSDNTQLRTESLHFNIFQCFCKENEAFATDAIVDPPLPFKG